MGRLTGRRSPNFDDRPAGQAIDTLVIHYTGMQSAEAALDRLCDPAAQVSAHYLIDEDGTIINLVDEAQRAWHAGVSTWRGRSGVNACSIGIELVNPGHEFGYRAFPAPQMEALTELALAIVSRHPIARRNVVGHSDVAPTRKADPGELFDWKFLADAGVGLWPRGPNPAICADERVTMTLGEIGYDVGEPHAALVAFQRHFAPHRLDRAADAETRRLLAAVAAEAKRES